MKLGLYIHSAVMISPQHTFEAPFLSPVENYTGGIMPAIEPDYSPYIPPVPIRRMSRLLKMAIAAGMRALKEAGIKTPAAILTGSGRASMSDTERFLTEMIRTEEGALNPTPFIQSTYNSPNGWLALLSGCTGYNTTYAHRGLSLEWALMDAAMLFREGTATAPVLVCSYDEMTPVYQGIKGKIGYWKACPPPSLDLLEASSAPGSIGGEGAGGFVFHKAPQDSQVCVEAVTMQQHPRGAADVAAMMEKALEESALTMEDVDCVLLGMAGDARFQPIYEALRPMFVGKLLAGFKHLCGEYDTASGFALWLATQALLNGAMPEVCVLQKGASRSVRTVLIVNHYLLGSWSATVVRTAPPEQPEP